VLKGVLQITSGRKVNNLKSKNYKINQKITINPFVIHRMKAITNCIYLEASTPESNDIVRLRDDYKRI
jgi:hypothetical protein